MELFDAIEKRHSYRGPFKPDAVPRDDLRRIVQAGLQAPTGTNAQPTRFIIIDDAALVAQINAMPGNQAIKEAVAYIVCTIDLAPHAVYEGMSFHVEDCAAAVENMLLAVTALGYATVWVDGWLRVKDRARHISTLVGLPTSKLIRVILPVGVPAKEHHQAPKMPFEERAFFNRYEGD